MSQSVSSINVLVGTSAENYVRGMDKAISQTKTKGEKWRRVMKTVSIGVGTAMLGVGIASTKMAVDFETSLTKMRTLVGLTAKDVEGFRTKIIDLSMTSGVSALELSDALYFITSSGLEGVEAFEALEASAKASAIGMGETEQIADALTSVLNAYGTEAYSAADATNILLRTVKLGKAEADELASSIGMVIPNAAQMGMDFEEVGAAISAITLTGKNASEAVTGINSILMALLKSTSKGSKALDSVGLSFEELRTILKRAGLSGVLQTINDKFGDNVEAVADVLGRKEAITTYFALTGKSAENYADALTMAYDKTNELNEAMEIYSDSTGAHWNVMTAHISAGMIALGEHIAIVYDKIRVNSQQFSTGKDWWAIQAEKDAAAAAKELEKLEIQAAATWKSMYNPAAPSWTNIDTRTVKDPKPTGDKDDPETLSEKVNRLNDALMQQSIAGEISAETMREAKEATAELAKANEDLAAAIVASSDIMSGGLDFLPYMEGEGMELISDEELDKLDETATKLKGISAHLEAFTEKYGVMIDFSIGALSRVTQMHATSMASQMTQLETRQESERAAIESTLGTGTAARERLKVLDEQHARERAKLATRAAKQQKALGIAQAAIHTAVAVAEALPNIALSIGVGILGAAEVGVIAGTAIPGYRFGTDHHFGGMAEINEGPSGGELVNLPRGASVTSTFDQMGGGKELSLRLDPHEIILYLRDQKNKFNYRSA